MGQDSSELLCSLPSFALDLLVLHSVLEGSAAVQQLASPAPEPVQGPSMLY